MTDDIEALRAELRLLRSLPLELRQIAAVIHRYPQRDELPGQVAAWLAAHGWTKGSRARLVPASAWAYGLALTPSMPAGMHPQVLVPESMEPPDADKTMAHVIQAAALEAEVGELQVWAEMTGGVDLDDQEERN